MTPDHYVASSKAIIANQPEVIPVVGGAAVTGIVTSGTAIVYATPLKVR